MIRKKTGLIIFALLCVTVITVFRIYVKPNHDTPSAVQKHLSGRIPVEINNSETDRIMFALCIGQSNAANYGETLYTPVHNVYNFYKGKLYKAEDPMPGATGRGGSVWGLLGDSLIERGYFNKVVFITVAVGSTTIESWSDGHCSTILSDTLKELKRYNIQLTYIFWHQGENDTFENTPSQLYKKRLYKIYKKIREYEPGTPLFISLASFTPWRADNPEGIGYNIRKAQKEFIMENKNVYTGPDTDTLISPEDRFDGVHFSEKGMKKYALLWMKAILGQQE